MNKNLQFIAAILITFTVVFLTSLLLELSIFKHWLRQVIVVLFIVVQLYLGFVVLKYLQNKVKS